ncbi:hypothetical protein A2303_00610 [Candidatus Falkowbacteria bacterium RIFOXYB2_FULL_47_14]|uniref:Uncharacterized protein n=1 Tax=Candidatus Falkowbacteria bacterium RIFOXYA2_FULL_47_19 TaxID=1797994 RepID=A0A1F5SM20_9BACT|nr:MAG: hypothetical protein A2227_04015 [Candidatus Falkowbacteria bacterium RIFOXYA2_FULL_47_19]OGF34716.1 MAG: hypothetical protein A2468_02560 [Candidatus Falkowbacteria bacterium RIFOXYC2_FULL_46_15]OGF42874.1 MAG: hypothetical protein A2303_00610 [Candidatus Falkowbacteria bacterium RIFOXYB2_FULL_47_14]
MKKSKTIIALTLLVAIAIFSPPAALAETYEYPNIQFLPDTAGNINFSALGIDPFTNHELVGVQGADYMSMRDVGKKHVVKLPPNTLAVINYNLRIIEVAKQIGVNIMVYEYGIAIVKK